MCSFVGSNIMSKPSTLTRIRALMKNAAIVGEQINAYIIPTDDAHQVSFTGLYRL